MSTKISKRVREEAIVFSAMCASTNALFNYVEASGMSQEAATLANQAWSAVWRLGVTHGAETNAEAECLLRDGWNPGDPVHLIAKEGK